VRTAYPVLFLLALSTSLALPVRAEPGSRPIYVRGSIGLAAQSLSAWNEDIREDERFFQSQGIPVSFEEFGPGNPLSLEAGYRVNSMISIGGSVSYQKASIDHSFTDFSGSLSRSGDLSLVGLTACLSFLVPDANGLFVGVDAGLGLGKAKTDFHFRDFSSPSNDLDGTGDWDGTGPIFGVFAGVEQSFQTGLILFIKGGYRYQNLGVFDGRTSSPQLGNGNGPPRNNAGQAIETDFSGLHVAFGLGFAFGR